MPSLTVFLDTSVLLSGLTSQTGGSNKLFVAAKEGKLQLIVSPSVVLEAEEHFSKLGLEHQQLEKLLAEKTVSLTANVPDQMATKFVRLSPDPDDAHILAGAVLSGADILVSLDKKHILTPTVKRSLNPILVLSPKELWKEIEMKLTK